ncbi:hypothetical protein BJV77DRAFT_1012468 [Russula vinacea]|nr:hypothetical protein BJV77DRAFT_1012468 [Russula vinacea]
MPGQAAVSSREASPQRREQIFQLSEDVGLIVLHGVASHHTAPNHSPSTATLHYTVQEPRGITTASHIIHATNGWTSHLLPGMQGKSHSTTRHDDRAAPRHRTS